MPVSLYGLSCDLDPIMKIAKKYKIGVINDAAEAHGSHYTKIRKLLNLQTSLVIVQKIQSISLPEMEELLLLTIKSMQ